MNIYIAYSHKSPYLPIAVADTAKELARMDGTTPNTIWSSISHGYPSYAKVVIR